MTDIPILCVKREDTYSRVRISTNEPNRIPWDVYYVVPSIEEEVIAGLFRTAWVVYPSFSTVGIMYQEWRSTVRSPYDKTDNIDNLRNLLLRNQACIVVPTYVTEKKRYAYQYARRAVRSRFTDTGKGLGKFYYLNYGAFEPACSYCYRASYFMTGSCTPGTNSCIQTFWRNIEQQT